MRRRLLWLMCALLLLAVVAILRLLALHGSATMPQDQVDIYEVVFRYQFEHSFLGGKPDSGAFFLLIDGRDPPESFLHRFDDVGVPIRRGSLYSSDSGIQFFVNGVQLIDPQRAYALGGYEIASRQAVGRPSLFPATCTCTNRYILSRKDNRWSVTNVENISSS
jgi:hypothetical protein